MKEAGRLGQMWNEFQEKQKTYMYAEVNKTNHSAHIITWKIIQGGPLKIENINWTLLSEDEDEEIRMSATEKSFEEFTDDKLLDDNKYQIYWLDVNKSGSIDKGDFIKVKAPKAGKYILIGKSGIWLIFNSGGVTY